jgi:hypothetical protein
MIYVAVALDAEARPLIAHFQLEKSDALQPLSVYRRSDLALIVAGVGKDSMASSVVALAKAIPPRENSVWLNVGVAGHHSHEIGGAVLARRVVDADTGVGYTLSPPTDLHLDIGEVRTVTHVETHYASEAYYEMEAAAFCGQTADLTSPELIQVLKIVSDNRRSGTLCVSARQVQGLVEENLPRVDLVVSSLHRQARVLSQ